MIKNHMATLLQMQIKDEEKKIIKQAAKVVGLGHTTFCRVYSLQKAREILNMKVNPLEDIEQV